MVPKLTKIFAIATLLLVAVPRTYAGPVLTLDDLLKGMSLKVNDLVFSNFGNFSSVGFLGGHSVDPKLVAVVPMMFNGAPGLMFQSPSQFVVGMGQQQETHFTFTVTSATSFITGAGMSFTAAAYGAGSATIGGALTAVPNGLLVSTLIPQNHAYGKLTGPLSSITINKDISLVGGGDPGSLTFLSDFSTSFSSSGVVPEPASATLLAIGVVALVGYRIRSARAGRTATAAE